MSSIFKQNYLLKTYENKKSTYPKKLCQKLIKDFNIKKGSKILDIGCGRGEYVKIFSELGMDVYGLDISVLSQKEMGEKIKIYNLEEKSYPFLDESFDFIFSKSVIEHLKNPDVLLDEAFRLLKKDGVFVCMTPSWKHSYKEAFYIDHTHVTPFTRYSLEKACEISGFKSECTYFYQLPILWEFPILNIFRIILNLLNLPYDPFNKVIWSEGFNKIIRFSKEAMLYCKSYKS